MDFSQQPLHARYGYPDGAPLPDIPDQRGHSETTFSEISQRDVPAIPPGLPWEGQQSSPPPGSPQIPGLASRRSHRMLKIIIALVLIFLFFFSALFSVQTFQVDGHAMEPTLKAGEQVLVNKLAYLFHAPSRGDVVVFHYPLDPSREFIERIIGIPGDTVAITANQVLVDGVLLREPYISRPVNTKNLTITVGTDQFFVMGDNRPSNSDSRDWGPISGNLIVGKAMLVLWPLSDWKTISSYPNVFGSIKR